VKNYCARQGAIPSDRVTSVGAPASTRHLAGQCIPAGCPRGAGARLVRRGSRADRPARRVLQFGFLSASPRQRPILPSHCASARIQEMNPPFRYRAVSLVLQVLSSRGRPGHARRIRRGKILTPFAFADFMWAHACAHARTLPHHYILQPLVRSDISHNRRLHHPKDHTLCREKKNHRKAGRTERFRCRSSEIVW